jgi:hypothetical protein
MKTKQIFATGLLTVLAFGSLTFMPASADSLESSAKATGTEMIVALNGMETPQHLVWDMTYGDLAPPADAADEPVVASENHDVTDLSVG